MAFKKASAIQPQKTPTIGKIEYTGPASYLFLIIQTNIE